MRKEMSSCGQGAACHIFSAKKQKKMQKANFRSIFFSFFIKYVTKRT